LRRKGYAAGGDIVFNDAMEWKGTRVEMNTVSNPKFYSVEYFSGGGDMKMKRYMKRPKKYPDSTDPAQTPSAAPPKNGPW
jgi:hypothetical protein